MHKHGLVSYVWVSCGGTDTSGMQQSCLKLSHMSGFQVAAHFGNDEQGCRKGSEGNKRKRDRAREREMEMHREREEGNRTRQRLREVKRSIFNVCYVAIREHRCGEQGMGNSSRTRQTGCAAERCSSNTAEERERETRSFGMHLLTGTLLAINPLHEGSPVYEASTFRLANNRHDVLSTRSTLTTDRCENITYILPKH